MSIWITDPTTKEKSPQLTAFIAGFIVCLAKLLASGISIYSFKIATFSGTDFAAAVGALGAIYSLHTHITNLNNQTNEKKEI
jgi:hypothetical protein